MKLDGEEKSEVANGLIAPASYGARINLRVIDLLPDSHRTK